MMLDMHICMQAGACTMTGGLAGYLYLLRIIAEVDSFQADSPVPIMGIVDMDDGPFKNLAMAFAGYRYIALASILDSRLFGMIWSRFL